MTFQLPGLPGADRCLVMGVVNVTPDSFSDGGQWFSADAAIAHGLTLAEQGADIVDVGGESTRPGAPRIAEDEELRRIGPVVTVLAQAGVPVSIDTMRAPVAELALTVGARLVNDVSGGLADPRMTGLIAEAGAPFVVMHWRGPSADMQERAVYRDVVREVRDELAGRVAVAHAAGVDPAKRSGRPRPRLRQAARAQLAAAHPPRRAEHARRGYFPDPGRRLEERFPQPPAGWPGRHAAAVR